MASELKPQGGLSGSLSQNIELKGAMTNLNELNGSLKNEVLRGYSAYQVAVALGFEGTEQEWLESLKGGGSADLSNYYTKKETNDKFATKEDLENVAVGDIDLSSYYTKTESDNKYQPKGNYLTEHQDLSSYAKKTELPKKVSELENDKGYLTKIPSEYVTEQELNGKGYLTEHQSLDAYAKKTDIPTDYAKANHNHDGKYQPVGNYALKNEIPTSPSQVGAEPSGTAEAKVNTHNTSEEAHNDIRLLVSNLRETVAKFLDVDDVTVDQLSEVLKLINDNKGDLESLTTSKVNVLDIIDNLTTSVSNKPLSAKQGVVLKALINAITVPTKTSQLTNDSNFVTKEVTDELSREIVDLQANKLDDDDVIVEETKDGYNIGLGSKNITLKNGKDGTIQLEPLYAESVEWLTENGDTTKLYVLPNGFIYGYFEAESIQLYTNRLFEADTDTFTESDVKTATKHEYYFEGVRLNSSGNMTTQSGSYVTGFIPYVYGGASDKIRVKNMGWCSSSNTMGVWVYDSNHVFVGTLVGYGKGTSTNFEEVINYADNGMAGRLWTKESDGQYMITYTPSESATVKNGSIDVSKIAYIRIFMGDFANAIITINEEIVDGGTAGGLGWNNTGHAFVPANYESRIIDLEERMNNLAPNNSGSIDLDYIRNWDMPIYDANIPVFETTATKSAILDSERNPNSLYAKYDSLMAQYPRYITKTDHGVCSDGVNHIYQYDFKAPKTDSTGSLFSETKTKAILMSGIHREFACAYGLYYALEELVSNPKLKHFLNNVHLIVLPCANPYAFDYNNGTHYQNANGVEIHRNFEVAFVNYEAEGDDQYSGSAPLSEIESQIIDNVMKANQDSAFVLSAHTFNNTTGKDVMWCSAGTKYTCNLACRLIQKMSVSFIDRFGNEFNGIDSDNPTMGWVSISGTGGSEYRQATKYGIQGFNLEVSETFAPHDTEKRTSFAMTRYAEVYANMLLLAFGVYDYKDKDKYCKYKG